MPGGGNGSRTGAVPLRGAGPPSGSGGFGLRGSWTRSGRGGPTPPAPLRGLTALVLFLVASSIASGALGATAPLRGSGEVSGTGRGAAVAVPALPSRVASGGRRLRGALGEAILIEGREGSVVGIGPPSTSRDQVPASVATAATGGSGSGGAVAVDMPPTTFPPEQPNSAYVAVCVASKERAENVREWVDYHAALGIGKFYVFDTDNAEPVGWALADLTRKGVVEYFALPHANPRTIPALQLRIYHECLEAAASRHHWIGFIDIDEFLVLASDSRDANEVVRHAAEVAQDLGGADGIVVGSLGDGSGGLGRGGGGHGTADPAVRTPAPPSGADDMRPDPGGLAAAGRLSRELAKHVGDSHDAGGQVDPTSSRSETAAELAAATRAGVGSGGAAAVTAAAASASASAAFSSNAAAAAAAAAAALETTKGASLTLGGLIGSDAGATTTAAGAAALPPPLPRTVRELLQPFEDEPGLVLNWRLMGSSGLERRPADPRSATVASYLACTPSDFPENAQVKSFVNVMAGIVRPTTDPHHFEYLNGRLAVNTDRVAVPGATSPPPARPLASLYHYALRSKEEFRAKSRRGSAMGNHKGDAFFERVDVAATDMCLGAANACARAGLRWCADAAGGSRHQGARAAQLVTQRVG